MKIGMPFRWLSVIIVPILLAAFLILWVYPEETGIRFAWRISSKAMCAMIGAGYLGGALYFTLIATGYIKYWFQAEVGVTAVFAFVLSMAFITVVHWDKFPHNQFPTQLWDLLYFGLPFVLGQAISNNMSTESLTDDNNFVSDWHRKSQFALGAILLVAGFVMLIFPNALREYWPWPTTTVTARALGGWMILPGVVGVLLYRKRLFSAWEGVVYAQMLSIVFMVIGAIANFSELSGMAAYVYISGLVLIYLLDMHIVYKYKLT